MRTKVQGEVITYGASLARRMEPVEVMAHLEHLDGNRAVGIIHLAIMPSYAPGVLNVEAWLENETDPGAAAKALQVAHQRLRAIYQLGPAPKLTVIDPTNSKAHHVAQQIVDLCRAARITRPGMNAFDRPREECVRLVMLALASGEMIDG